MALIFLCLGWLAGIYLGLAYGAGVESHLLLEETQVYLAGLFGLTLLACVLGRHDRVLRLAALVLACALLGVWRGFSSLPDLSSVPRLSGQVLVHGVISGRPEPHDNSLQFVLDVDGVKQHDSWQPTKLRVLVTTDRFQEWSYGDTLMASAELRPVSGQGYWATSLSRQGIYSTMEFARLERESRGDSFEPLRVVNSVRDRLQVLCGSLLPEPQASLLAGILVGGRVGMPDGFMRALNATSTSHLVAVSGFNVTVVAGTALLFALRFLGRRRATVLALVAVWAYTLITGLPPSAVRAAIMASMSLTSILVGRDSDALSFMALSAALMTCFDPFLLYDLGFQLSFLATVGLILVEPVLRSWIGRLPGAPGRAPAWLVSALTVTLAAQLATMPVIATTFHTVSLVSPLTNLLLAPALTGIMGTGAAALSLGAISETLGRIFAPLAWIYLTYMVEIVERTSMLPSASVSVGNLDRLLVAVYYLTLLAIVSWPLPEMRWGRERLTSVIAAAPKPAVAACALAAICLLGLVGSARADTRTHVYFLDVGQGSASLVRTPSGRSILVDGGPSPTALENGLSERLGFLDRGLDAVVVTGYRQDNLTGMMEVVRRHDVGLALEPGRPVGSRAAISWAELLAERQLPTVRAETGQRIDLGDGSYLEVTWASDREAQEPAMAVMLVVGTTRVMLPGDSPVTAFASIRDHVEVLGVPRQGATGALEEQSLGRLSPRVAVISVAANNRFGHPSEATLQQLRGSSVFRTDRHGTIDLSIGADGYEVYTER